MSTAVLRWQDPPPPGSIPRAVVAGDDRIDWRLTVDVLRNNPDEWAVVGEGVTHAAVNGIRQRLRRWGQPDVEIVVRTTADGSTFDVYARAQAARIRRRAS